MMCGRFALLLLCVALAAGNAQSAESYTLSGTVVDYATGKPLPDMKVALYNSSNLRFEVEPVTSGPDGRFTFYGLEAGQYEPNTWLQGEFISFDALPSASLTVLNIGPDFRNPEITFRVALHPSIEGIVRDESGDPVAHVNVNAFRANWMDGQTVPLGQAQATTDDRGHYRISGLAPGAYVVCTELMDTSNNQWFRTIAPEPASTVDFSARDRPRFYARSCYPGDPPASFKLDWGHDAHVDLKFALTSGTKIQGRVTNGDPRSISINLNLVADDQTITAPGAQVQSDGTFDLSVIEPGRYVLYARSGTPGGQQLVAQQIVIADKTPVTGLQLTMQPVGTIPVFIQAPASLALKPGSVNIGLRPVSSGSRFTYWAQRTNDGSLSFPSIDPGKYWVRTQTDDPFCVESITFGGRAVLHDTLTVSPGESGRLDVVLSNKCAAIEGKVITKDRADKYPLVALLMSGTAQTPGDVFTTYAAEDGSFTVANLPPGRYLLWAWSQSDPGYPGPERLADVANQATVVQLTRGQHAAIQFPSVGLK